MKGRTSDKSVVASLLRLRCVGFPDYYEDVAPMELRVAAKKRYNCNGPL